VMNHGSASDTFCLMTFDLTYSGRAGQIINQMMRDSSRHVDIIIYLPPDTATDTVGVRGGVESAACRSQLRSSQTHRHVGQTSETYPLAHDGILPNWHVMCGTTGVKTDKLLSSTCTTLLVVSSPPHPHHHPHLLHASVLRVPCHLDPGRHGSLAVSCSCFPVPVKPPGKKGSSTSDQQWDARDARMDSTRRGMLSPAVNQY
jgi:hypothetical protein